MTPSIPVAIECKGLVLEGQLHQHRTGVTRGGAVVCHPHPLYGGDMNHPVVVALARSLAAAGFTALRFNFRGVGGSEGVHGGGGPETEDVAAALQLVAREAGPEKPLALAGYSFGAWVAYAAAGTDPRVRVVLCVSLPLNLMPAPAEAPCSVARWFALGDRDEFCDPQTFRDWYGTQEGPGGVLELPGTDHFLTGRELAVGTAAAAFAAAQLERSNP